MSEREGLWKRAAARAASDRFYLAFSLCQYQSAQRLSDAELASVLGCAQGDLPRLSLCRCPDTRSAQFSNEVAHIADRYGLKPSVLAAVIRHVAFTLAVQTTAHLTATQTFAPVAYAAQDRGVEEDEESNIEGDET